MNRMLIICILLASVLMVDASPRKLPAKDVKVSASVVTGIYTNLQTEVEYLHTNQARIASELSTLSSNTVAWVNSLSNAVSGNVTYPMTVVTGNTTADSGKMYAVDTSSAAITITLPAALSAGDRVVIFDAAGNASTHNITIGRGTSSPDIQGVSEDLVLNTDYTYVELIYVNATLMWRIIR